MDDVLRVLYVDDEPGLLEITRLFLEKSGDFTVTTALSAHEAIRLLETEKFDVIISDHHMPGMDGIPFLVEVRTRFGKIPFILFTGKGREEVVIQAINSGADFYLQKGGDPGAQFAELIHKVRQAASWKKADDALKKSEEKYRHLIEHSDEAIVVEQEGMPRLVNHRAVELTGYSEQELLSMSFPGFIHPDDRSMVMERYKKRMMGEEAPTRSAFRLNPKDKSTRWVEASIITIDWEGQPATLNFLTDITDRKRVDEAIRTAEDTYRNIFLNSQIGLFRTDMRSGLILDANDAVARFIGYKDRASLLSGPFNIVDRYVDMSDHQNIISLLLADGEFRNYEARFRKNDGSIIWMRFSGRLVSEKGWVEGVSEDITERKQAEEEIRQQSGLIKSLIDSIPDIIFFKDTQGVYLVCNPPFAGYVGKSRDEIVGKTDYDIFDKEIAGNFRAHDTRLLEFGEPCNNEEWVTYPDGRKILLDSRKIPYRGPDGTVIGVLGISRDITGCKELEKQIKYHQQELIQLSTALSEANRKINLLSGITRQDINNELTELMEYLTILEEKLTDPAQVEYSRKVRATAEQISAMIRLTREYEQIGVHAPSWQVCRTLVDTAAKQIPGGQVIIKNDLPAGMEVFADPLIARVFYNLIDNAIGYGGKSTTIRFYAGADNGDRVIICDDDGGGVPSVEKEKIFKREFGRSRDMGLFLSREILSITGITISETGDPGTGARFEIMVPKGSCRRTGNGA